VSERACTRNLPLKKTLRLFFHLRRGIPLADVHLPVPRTNHACFARPYRATLSRLAGLPSNTDPWPPTSVVVLLSGHWLKSGGRGACLSRVRLSRRWCQGTGNLVWGNADARGYASGTLRPRIFPACILNAWGRTGEWTCQARDSGLAHMDKGGAVVAGRSWGVLGSVWRKR
jgi:hypothetical protein